MTAKELIVRRIKNAPRDHGVNSADEDALHPLPYHARILVQMPYQELAFYPERDNLLFVRLVEV